MENNFVNIKLKKFIYYLNNIGLLPKECNCQIINIFYQLGNIYLNTNEILKSNIDYINRTFKENIIKTLSVFLNSLTKEQNNIISLNIYHNYTNKENLLNIEKAYIFNKLFIKLKLKRAFHKIFFFSKENHNYNFLYSINPTLSNNTCDYSNYKDKIQKFKKIQIYTRNTDNNSKIRLPHLETLNELNTQNNKNNIINISKLSDLGINCTFSKECSPFINQQDLYTQANTDANINHVSHKQIKFPIKIKTINAQIKNLNKKPNLKLKLTPHFTIGKDASKENTNNNITEQGKKNCEFKTKKNKLNQKRIEKLYLDNQRIMDKRAEGIILRDSKISKENTFQPNFVSTSVKKLKKNFSLRMNQFNILKEEKKIKLMKTIETENNIIYTFSPKLNVSHSQNITNKNKEKKVPVYERLYTKNKYLKRQIEESKLESKSLSIKSKTVDYQKIQKLYEEYKLQKQKRKTKQKLLDEERGLTFNPLLINGNKYKDRITPGFLEREKKFIEEHQNHINAYRKFLNKEKEKYFKRYSKDKKIIIKNVVNRLYNEEINKKMNLNNYNNENNYIYAKTENNNLNDNYNILTKSNKNIHSLEKKERNKLKNCLSNKEISIPIKNSEKFSLSQLIDD